MNPESRRTRTAHDPDRFSKELYFFSYLAHLVVEYSETNDYCITKHTKIAANYTQDWGRIGTGKHKPYFTLIPNPYGIVAVVPEGILYRKHIYELGSIAKNCDLWCIESEGSIKPVRMLSSSEELRAKLLGFDAETKFSFGFTHDHIGTADILARIYSKLSREELNILASHRNSYYSQECIDYELKLWETNYQEFRRYSVRNSEDSDVWSDSAIKSILRMAIACEQIEIKSKYIFSGIEGVVSRLERMVQSNEFVFSEECTINGIIEDARKKTHLDEGERSSFIETYIHNIELLYPITKSIIETVDDIGKTSESIDESQSLKKQGAIINLVRALEADPVIEAPIRPKEVHGNLSALHDEAKKIFGTRLKTFSKRNPTDKEWEITG